MTQQEGLSPFFISSYIATISFALAAHAWLCRDDLIASVALLKQLFQTFVTPAGLCTRFDANVRSEFDKVRKARGIFYFQVFSIPVTSLCMLIVLVMTATNPDNRRLILMALFLLGRHIACLCYSYYIKFHRIAAVDISLSLIFKCSMCMFAVVMYNAKTDDFLMNGGLRCALRVFNAIVLLDYMTALKWNACFSVVVFFCVWNRREHLCVDGRSPMEAFVSHCLAEVCTLFCVVAIPAFLESCERDRIRAYLESSQSSQAYQAVQRMLSAFCDAQLRIGPQSNIIAHSPHLVHLLGSEDRQGETRATLTGDSFSRYIGEPDRQRFLDFISAAAAPQSGDAPLSRSAASPGEDPGSDDGATGPATSIQVSLRKEGGAHPTPVQLFLIRIPYASRAPEVLMGIRETGEALPREACTDAPGAVALQLHAAAAPARGDLPLARSRGAAPGAERARAAPGPPAGELQHGPRAAAPAPARAQPSLQAAPPPGALAKPAVHHPGGRPRSSRSASSRSSASRRSGSASGSSALEAGQVSSVRLRLDTATRDVRIREMVLRFEVGPRAPCLKDWVQSETLDRVHRSCQAVVNAGWYGDGGEADGGLLGALQFCSHGSAFLLAERAELAAPDSGDSDESEDDLDLIATLNLHGVSMHPMPWQMRRPRVSRSLYPIDESPASSEA